MGPLIKEAESRPVGCIEPMLMSMDDLQRVLGCGKTSAFAIVGRGDIETVQIGRKRLALVGSVRSYVERLRQAQRPTNEVPELRRAS